MLKRKLYDVAYLVNRHIYVSAQSEFPSAGEKTPFCIFLTLFIFLLLSIRDSLYSDIICIYLKQLLVVFVIWDLYILNNSATFDNRFTIYIKHLSYIPTI